MYQEPYQQYTSSRGGASFGAEVTAPPLDGEMRLVNLWQSAKLMTPQWLKESLTITAGVFGAMTLFHIFQRKLPKPQ